MGLATDLQQVKIGLIEDNLKTLLARALKTFSYLSKFILLLRQFLLLGVNSMKFSVVESSPSRLCKNHHPVNQVLTRQCFTVI